MAGFGENMVPFFEYLCVFIGISGSLLIKINQKQPMPYMDEIFHIPQVQKYCEGKFQEWDPMITTLPGLYLTTIGSYIPFGWLFGYSQKVMCSIFWLRAINVGFATGNVILLKLLMSALHKNESAYNNNKGTVTAAALSMFPVLYFFSFLYYTDAGSTFCVLLMYLLSLKGHHLKSAGIGVLAVLFRQTNIVWLIFSAGTVVSHKLVEYIKPTKKGLNEDDKQNHVFFRMTLKIMLRDLKHPSAAAGEFWCKLFKILAPYLTTCVMFIVFVLVNGSIVVGAKDDHQVSCNFPQLFYFSVFTGFFSLAHLISVSKIKNFVKFIVNNPVFIILFVLTSAVLVYYFTQEHKYLLADNRHYTFYFWHRLYKKHFIVKYALIPGYLYAWWSVFNSLEHQNFLWKLLFFFIIVVNLVPQLLLEFRYFIIPYLMFRLHCKVGGYLTSAIEIIIYLLINVSTIYMFMEKPFLWPNQSELQRFLW